MTTWLVWHKSAANTKASAEVTEGIEAVIKAMNMYLNNSDVCEQGCGTLWNVTFWNSKTIDKHRSQ